MCLAQQFGDSPCSGHLPSPVTTGVPPSPINTQVNAVTPGSPGGGHRDLPDGLLYGLQPRPAVGKEVEHGEQPRAEGWPLSSAYGVSSPACPCASSSCLGSLFRAGNISSQGALSHSTMLLLCSGAHKPSLEKRSVLLGNTPWAQTCWPDPALTSGVPACLSPAHAHCTASAHMPFA